MNQIGAYGDWAAGLAGAGPGSHSLRSGRFADADAWKAAARAAVWESLAAPASVALPETRTESVEVDDGVRTERLSWQLPSGERTGALFLLPEDHDGRPLPGVLALHDHGDIKAF